MSDLKRCDKCQKLIKGRNYINITVTNRSNLLEMNYFDSLDLCVKCGAVDYKKLQKIFPNLE
jgi:hypothetical protein